MVRTLCVICIDSVFCSIVWFGCCSAYSGNDTGCNYERSDGSGNMLPAVGMAMLLQMLWNNKIAIYFLLGFILVAYLDLPLIAIAVLGTIIAVVTAQRDMQLKNNQAAPVEKTSEEEDFFA